MSVGIMREQAGTYLQIAHKVRINRPGRPDLVSNRPRNIQTGVYLDADAPTLVTLEEGDMADFDMLLKVGVIRPSEKAPAPSQRKAAAIDSDGGDTDG